MRKRGWVFAKALFAYPVGESIKVGVVRRFGDAVDVGGRSNVWEGRVGLQERCDSGPNKHDLLPPFPQGLADDSEAAKGWREARKQ